MQALLFQRYAEDIKLDISQYPEEKVIVSSVTQSPTNKDMKFVVVKKKKMCQEETLLFHTDLGLGIIKL